VRDGPGRRALKGVARALFAVNLRTTRAWRRARGSPPPFDLGGACALCAACCEAPAVRANAWVWHVRLLRRAFLAWQERVNGFVLAGAEARVFTFRCTHFDAVTRRCDSYDSRPGMCRDYPRALLDQPAPELLAGCGYRAVFRGGEAMIAALRARGVPEDRVRSIADQLRLR
jgi:hypothetical protein